MSFTTLYVFVLGLALGSFFNVVVYRLPLALLQEGTLLLNLIFPRSHCPQCKKPLRIQDNIPLFSYLNLRNRCHWCKHKISWRYPAVELATAILLTLVVSQFGLTVAGLGAAVFVSVLLILFFIDLETMLLPDQLTYPLIWIGLLINIQNIFTNLPSAVIGAVSGYLFLWLFFWIFRWLTGKDGMGYGDFKLLSGVGAFLGYEMLPQVLLLASLVGTIVGIALIFLKKIQRDNPIPFGPYLSFAGILTLFVGRLW